MFELLDRIHLLFTGVRASAIFDDPIEEGTPGSGTLSDFTVYAGLDRLPGDMPDYKYPYMVIEPGEADQEYVSNGVAIESVNIGFSVLVEGQQGALFGKSETAQKGIAELYDIVKAVLLNDQKLTIGGTLSPYTCQVTRLSVGSFVTPDERGVIYSRGCDLTVAYRRTDWTGL